MSVHENLDSMYRPSPVPPGERVTLTFTKAALEGFIQLLNASKVVHDGYRIHFWVVTYGDNEATIGTTSELIEE